MTAFQTYSTALTYLLIPAASYSTWIGRKDAVSPTLSAVVIVVVGDAFPSLLHRAVAARVTLCPFRLYSW